MENKERISSNEELFINPIIAELTKAEGNLVSLKKESLVKEPLFASVRIGAVNFWEDTDHVATVDVFAHTAKGEYFPVGHFDKQIYKDKAFGKKARGDALESRNSAQRNARWSGEAIKVDRIKLIDWAMREGFKGMNDVRDMGLILNEDYDWSKYIYAKQGIGSFMTGLMILSLKKYGIKTLETGDLNLRSQSIWNHYKAFSRQTLMIDELVGNHYLKESLDKFVK